MEATFADPDLQIKGEGGGGHTEPEIWGGGEAASELILV